MAGGRVPVLDHVPVAAGISVCRPNESSDRDMSHSNHDHLLASADWKKSFR